MVEWKVGDSAWWWKTLSGGGGSGKRPNLKDPRAVVVHRLGTGSRIHVQYARPEYWGPECYATWVNATSLTRRFASELERAVFEAVSGERHRQPGEP